MRKLDGDDDIDDDGEDDYLKIGSVIQEKYNLALFFQTHSQLSYT